MAGPGDEIAAAAESRGHLRASHADREQVIGILKVAFVQGMLPKDEFDLRVGQALASRTHAHLAALTADIPAGLAPAQPPKPGREQGKAPVPRLGRALAVTTVLYVGLWLVMFALPKSGPDHDPHGGIALIGAATFVYFFFALTLVAQILSDWLDKRSRRQLPQGPAPGAVGQASRRLPSAGPGGQLPPADPGPVKPPKLDQAVTPARHVTPKQHSPESGLIAVPRVTVFPA